MEYDDVLVPTDGSSGTRAIAARAVDLAETFDARIHALYVVGAGGVTVQDSGVNLSPDLTREGERATDSVVQRAAAAGVPATAAVRDGAPHDVILEYVEEAGIDLVVMGTHGRSGLDRVVLGSVTERVVRLSPVPVLTVSLPGEEQVVTSEERAVELAGRALEREGHEGYEIEDVHRTHGTWIVQVRREDDRSLNVHVDASTEAVRIAELTDG